MSVFADEARKLAVWSKGRIISGWNPYMWRLDSYGGYMLFSAYGQGPYGWEIDHIDPNGSDDLSNLQPLYWLNNRRKSDKSPLSLLNDLLFKSGRDQR